MKDSELCSFSPEGTLVPSHLGVRSNYPLPTDNGEIDRWEDWSWQLKRYVGLYKPLAKVQSDDGEDPERERDQ